MLESLSTIDVRELNHTSSEVGNVHEPTDNATAETAQTSDAVVDILHYSIWHQNSTYEDIASAVCLLIERLQSDPVQDKDEILLLLAYIARGNSYADSEQSGTDRRNTSEFKEPPTPEPCWISNAHAAVAAGLNVYLALLTHEQPMVRTCAAYTLACFKEYSSKIIPTLLSCIDIEEDQLAKASQLLSLGTLAEYNPASQKLLLDIVQGGKGAYVVAERRDPIYRVRGAGKGAYVVAERSGADIARGVGDIASGAGQASDLVKLAAAIALAKLPGRPQGDEPPPAPQGTRKGMPLPYTEQPAHPSYGRGDRKGRPAGLTEAIRVLVDTIVHPESTQEMYVELPWAETDVVGDTSNILYMLGPHAAQIAIPMFIEALMTKGSHNSLCIVDALLYLAFNGGQVNTDLTDQTLTAEQRTVLTTIANSNCAWVINIINTGKTSEFVN